MSILLDSLRKSEAQRKAGDTPTIYSTQEYGSSGAGGSKWVLWLLLALTGIAIVWFGWQQYSFPGDSVASGQLSQEQAAATERQSAEVVVPGRSADNSTQAIARSPVEQIGQGVDAADPASTDRPGAGDNDTSTPLERIADFIAENEPAPAVESGEQARSEPVDSEELALMEESDDQEDPGEIAAPDRPLGSRLSRTDPRENEPLSYWQLEQGLRNNLPEFKITVLVYAEAPEDRFLLMNGERMQEGDELEGVSLEEIRRDGAVFSYQSYRFLVKN